MVKQADTAGQRLSRRHLEVGVGLWSMQSTPPGPRSHFVLYDELLMDARRCEELGFDSIWLSEHHLWFDGYCPSPLVAAAAALGVTKRLRVGTAVTLLPLQNPVRLADVARQLHSLSGARFTLGVGAGYRFEEFEAFGVRRSERGKIMDQHLAALSDRWVGEAHPELLLGAGTAPAVDRAARSGSGLLLPPPLTRETVSELVQRYRNAGGNGRVGIMRDLWVDEAAAQARATAEPWVSYAHAQYAAMEGLTKPEEIRAFSDRSSAQCVIGTPTQALDALAPLLELQPDLLLLRVKWGDQPGHEIGPALERISWEMLPSLRRVAP